MCLLKIFKRNKKETVDVNIIAEIEIKQLYGERVKQSKKSNLFHKFVDEKKIEFK